MKLYSNILNLLFLMTYGYNQKTETVVPDNSALNYEIRNYFALQM